MTATKDYYALVISQRKYASAQQSSEQAKHFLAITQDEERLGAAARTSSGIRGIKRFELNRHRLELSLQ